MSNYKIEKPHFVERFIIECNIAFSIRNNFKVNIVNNIIEVFCDKEIDKESCEKHKDKISLLEKEFNAKIVLKVNEG